MKSKYQRAKDLLDKVFSMYIRLRDQRRFGQCVICNQRPIACCFHFLPRGNTAIRWDADNAVGACCACNYHEHMNRGRAYSDDKYLSLHIRLIGEGRRQRLEQLARKPFKKSADELLDMKREFETRMGRGI